MEDFEIVELYFLRNEQAISETKIKYGKRLHSIAWNILRNHEDAQECENDTYLSAWNQMPPTRPSFLLAFLTKISRNIAIRTLRSKSADKRGGGEAVLSLTELEECIPDRTGFSEAMDAQELAQHLNLFLHTLSQTQRAVFVRRYFQCASIAEIANSFGFSENKVKTMLFRLRTRLRSFLEKEEIFV